MLHRMEGSRRLWLRLCAVLASSILFAACASTISARVTSFQQWPAQTEGQTYKFMPAASQTNNLEYQAFADMIRASIGATGLVEAPAGTAARFSVSLDYDNPESQGWVQQSDPYFHNGFGPGWGGGFYGMNHGWGGGLYLMPSTITVPVRIYSNRLTVTITDSRNNGAEVYRSTAVSTTSDDNLAGVMPYLTHAVFDGFPGNNGQVRDMTFERRGR